jgi:hypothetical protein
METLPNYIDRDIFMKYNKLRYFELLKYSQDLANKGKWLYEENREAFFELLNYQILIEDHIFWQKRHQFLSVIKNFINGTLDSEEFSDEFFAIRRQNQAVHEAFKIDFEKLENFEPDSRSKGFSSFIGKIFSDCEVFEPNAEEGDNYNKKWLKDSVKDARLQIQKY